MGRKPRRQLADAKTAVAYVRVSTDAERQALGAEAQRQAIEAWAAKEGVKIAEWFTEEVSGGAPLEKRTGLLDAVAAVSAHHAGLLVVHKLDRFTRDTTAAAIVGLELTKAGAKLLSVSGEGNGDDPASKMMRSVLLAVAEYERAIIKARIRAALAVKKGRGEMTGAPRFGFQLGPDGVHVEPCKSEQKVIAQVKKLRKDGLSMRDIRDELEADGAVGRAGTPISHHAVFTILKRQA